MNILVAGGAGYIGSRLVPFLAEQRYRVAVWDTEVTNANLGLDFVDARKSSISEVLKVNRYDVVVHLVGTYNKDQDISHNINFRLAVDSYQDCNQNDIGCFVFMSTCGVLNPEDNSEYTRQKRLAEAALLEASKGSPSSLKILRLAPVYGLAPNMKYDSIVNGFIKDALSQGSIDVWGKNEYRPIVDICTVVDEIRRATQNVENAGSIHNIASGNLTKGEIAAEIKKCLPNIDLILRDNDKKGYKIDSIIPGRILSEGIREVISAKIL